MVTSVLSKALVMAHMPPRCLKVFVAKRQHASYRVSQAQQEVTNLCHTVQEPGTFEGIHRFWVPYNFWETGKT